MRRGTLCILLLTVCALGLTDCGGGSHIGLTITTAPTSLAVGASGNVAATVTHDPSNSGVRWTCTPVTACGAVTVNFDPASTASGATSVFTAPPAIPPGGQVTIIATSVANPLMTATANVTITSSNVASNNFVFFATGEENNADSQVFYSIAGVVAISTDGNNTILGGEQDYNDGLAFTSPQPAGDFITGGSLTVAPNGQAILTLVTNNPNLGVSGTETFALAYSSASHALITQFDGSATSSGSFDFQSSTSAPVSSSFSFVASGVDSSGLPIVDGGVFALDASSNLTGTVDVNDGGTVTLNTAIPAGAASLGVTDSLGRGAISGSTGIATAINYYVVGPEVLRIINVDTTDTAVGSAYGQGSTTGSFDNASIGASVFSVDGGPSLYSGVGQFTTDAGAALRSNSEGTHSNGTTVITNNFTGVGDENESVLNGNAPAVNETIDGTYTIAGNGYGSLSFTDGLGSISAFGVYMVDPTLNILDPNNATDANGGALIAEMDANLVGAGALIPQTDPALDHFRGLFALGAQGYTNTDGVGNDEFDFVAEGGISSGALTATGVLSDPFAALTGTAVESPNATFNAAFVERRAGRSTASLTIGANNTPPDFGTVVLTVTLYQANAGQAFWVEVDNGMEFGGSIQSSTLPVPDLRKTQQKSQKH
jgi:hypothetical protein